MVDYDDLLNSGYIVAPRLRKERDAVVTEVTIKTHRNSKGVRAVIAIPPSVYKELGFEREDHFNVVILPSGKYCLCKVRPHLGYKTTTNTEKAKTRYLYIPRLETKNDGIFIGYIEDGLIVFPEGSFE